MITVTERNRSLVDSAFSVGELIYHNVVRAVRKQSGGATLGLLYSVSMSLIMLAVFYLMYETLQLRHLVIRGDFVVYLLTGIFLFLTHNLAIRRVMTAETPIGPMMKHPPMNSVIAIASTAFSVLYLQTLSMFLVLFAVHVLRGGLDYANPGGMVLPFLLAWSSGVAIGLIFRVLKPFFPRLIPMFAAFYRRANMITSGKMLPANFMGATMAKWFSWNPLFHAIDQSRGEAFINYYPRYTNIEYPIYFTVVVITIGLMADFSLRKNMSLSWGKRQI
ncbi:MAG: ABC transporter permease [Paracoccaceae bacterium]